ncbi:sugar ABC transporter substrate-binding protein [Pandoraea pnomenusa]|uniref:TMAO reductase system protein TorT n=1 Tax=Pandoraea pnomenusa TaxID=93220 RepID=UPI00119833B7|nr:TMAO reductase system protein TorT [Pandoraea pnomenusa]QDX20868.1 sugar ABC transporter substrate-binding protein [Pandoraea pnomenusa]
MKIKKTLLAVSLALSGFGTAHAQKAVTIGYATPDLSSSFWVSMTYGVEDEARKLGVTLVKLNAGGDANVSTQISQIQDLTERKVDAMVVGATNGEAVRSVVEHAIGTGIPVVGLSSLPASNKLAATVGANHYEMGRLQAQCLGDAMGGKGEVAMISQQQGQSWADRRRQGFLDTLKASYPNIKVVAESRNAVTRNDAINLVDNWLQRFPDLGGIYNAVDDSAAGALIAVKGAQRRGRVKISASNLSQTAQQMIKSGDLVCTSAQQIVTQGREALRQAVAAAGHKPVQRDIQAPSIMISSQNLTTVDLSLLSAPASYRP